MIIDGHSNACRGYFTSDSLIATIDKWGVDKVILVPGELNSKISYSLLNLTKWFPKHNVFKLSIFFKNLNVSNEDHHRILGENKRKLLKL